MPCFPWISGISLFCLSGSASPLFDKGEIIFHGESVIVHTHNHNVVTGKWVISSALLCKSYNCEAHGPLYSIRGFYSNMKLSLLSVKVFYRKKPKFKERRKSSKSKLRYVSCHYINTPFNTCKLSCLFFQCRKKRGSLQIKPESPCCNGQHIWHRGRNQRVYELDELFHQWIRNVRMLAKSFWH